MTDNNFNEADKQKLIDFLNIVAKNATFTMKTDEIVNFFKLLAHMQQVILPKMDTNILEVLRVVEPPKADKEPTEPKKRK